MAPGHTVPRHADPTERAPAPSRTIRRSAAPSAPSAARALEDRLGHRAAQAQIARSLAPSVQRAAASPLRVSHPNDPAEREAEHIARAVTRMHDPPVAAAAATHASEKDTVQRA